MKETIKETKFICVRYPSLKVTVKPARTLVKADGVTVPIPALRAEFERGLLITGNQSTIERLRNHLWFGVHITEITPEAEAKIKKQAKIEAEVRKEVEERIATEEKGASAGQKAKALGDKGKKGTTKGKKGKTEK